MAENVRPVLAEATAVEASWRPIAVGGLGVWRRSLVGRRQMGWRRARRGPPARRGGRTTQGRRSRARNCGG
eukprot:5992185-Lingulodinium_polyedra.AAC.1